MSANPLSWADVIVLAKALGKQDDALTPASVMEKYIAPLNARFGEEVVRRELGQLCSPMTGMNLIQYAMTGAPRCYRSIVDLLRTYGYEGGSPHCREGAGVKDPIPPSVAGYLERAIKRRTGYDELCPPYLCQQTGHAEVERAVNAMLRCAEANAQRDSDPGADYEAVW